MKIGSTPADRAALITQRTRSTIGAIIDRSLAMLEKSPPAEQKSFCTSMINSAVCAGSTISLISEKIVRSKTFSIGLLLEFAVRQAGSPREFKFTGRYVQPRKGRTGNSVPDRPGSASNSDFRG